MLFVGSDDGVYRTTGAFDADPDVERVLDSGQAMRVRAFDGVDGVFAATTTGLYHSSDGEEWTDLDVPTEEVYAVGASPDADRLYAGTRPARLYVADADGLGSGGVDWAERERFRELGERDGWGIDRHENVAQVRDVHALDGRLVVGVEVGGVYVSDDGGTTWADRRVRGFDAPHLDDVHHVAVVDRETFVAATGSGLYRTTDAGRTWSRLDADHPAWYFRESYADAGVVYAGGSTSAPSSWDGADHALFECRGDRAAVDSPVPGEVAVGWTERDGDPVAVTDRGTLLVRDGDWETAGTVPAADSVYGRCIPLAWL